MSSDQDSGAVQDCSSQNLTNAAAVTEEGLGVPSNLDVTSKSPTMDSGGDRDAAKKDPVEVSLIEISTAGTAPAATTSMSQAKSDDAVASTSRGIELRRQPLRKARIRKSRLTKKKSDIVSGSGTDSYLSSDSEFQIADSMEVIDPEIDTRLEENASRNKLNAINVKNILREVLTNEEVVSMLRNSLQFPNSEADRQSPEPATYELRMTRSKVKKVLTEEKVPKPWPTILEERPTFLDLEFPDDEEDDEYKPEEETIDEEKEPESEVSTLHIDVATEEEPTLEGDDIIATRTRSKLPMTGTRLEEIEEAFVAPDITADMYETECDDSEWQEFLAGLIKTDPVKTLMEAVEEDPNDPDFNYLAAPENEDDEEEDFKFEHFDRPFRVSKMEVNQLIDDLREWFPDDEEELVPLEGKSPKKKIAPVEKVVPKVPSTSTPTKTIPQSPEVGEETFQEDPDSSIPVFTAEQRETLKAQLQQHVQLVSQMFVLSLSDRSHWESSEKTRKILLELDVLQRISPAKQQSVYRACPLKEAVDLTAALLDNEWVKRRPPVPIAKVKKGRSAYYLSRYRLRRFQREAFLNSPVFAFGKLLPERGLASVDCSDRRLEFRRSEDMLIALALEQLNHLGLENKYELIHSYWMPCKDPVQIRKRVINMGQTKCSNSPLVYFRKNGVVPPCECKMQPRPLVAPRYQPPESLSERWIKHSQNEENLTSDGKKKRKRSRSISSSRERPWKRQKHSGMIPKVMSVPNSPEMVTDESCPEPLDLASLFRLPLPELKKPEQKTPEKKCYTPIAPKPFTHSPLLSPAVSPFLPRSQRRQTAREARPSPKKTLIFPKNYTMDHKNISPTKRAALSVMKRAQHTYQRSSPCKIALSPRNWASYAKSLGRVSAPATVTTAKMAASPSLPAHKVASDSPRGRARQKEKTAAAIQDNAENEQIDDMLEDAGKDEENEQNQEDDTFHLDQLMAASTTIQFDPKKGHGSNSASRPSRTQRRKDLKLTLLAGDLVEVDPKRDEKDTAFAKEYLNKVRQALKTDMDLYMKFLQKMADFGHGLLTPVELYGFVKVFLKDYPNLVEDFSAFLLSGQAVECNCFGPNNDLSQARTFLRKLELCFEKQPTQFQRILKVFADWNGNREKTPDELRDLLKPFLRHIPDLAEELTTFFSNEKPPEAVMSEFETMVLDDEALASKTVQEAEEIDFPDDADPYRTTRCPCRCHDDVTDKKYHERIKHCLKCSLKVIYGKVFFQFSKKRLVPACITYFDPLPEPEAADHNKEGVGRIQENHVASVMVTLGNTTIASTTTGTYATASIRTQPLKRMKLKLTGTKAHSKGFVSLSEVLVSPSKDPDRSNQGNSDEEEAQQRGHARVITETIPRYPGLQSMLEMQPTALSEDTVSCSADASHPRMDNTAVGAGVSVHPRQPASIERPGTSSIANTGTRGGPRVILRITDGTSRVILSESDWADTAQASDRAQLTAASGSLDMTAVPSPSCDWINSSPSKSQDSSDLLSKALRHAQICQMDAEFSMDGSLSGPIFQHPESQLMLPVQTVTCGTGTHGVTETSISGTAAQGCTPAPSGKTAPMGMENLVHFQGNAVVKVEVDDQTEASASNTGPVWTREIDRVILEACKAHGIGPDTFVALEKMLPGLSAEQLERRLNDLLEILASTEDWENSG